MAVALGRGGRRSARHLRHRRAPAPGVPGVRLQSQRGHPLSLGEGTRPGHVRRDPEARGRRTLVHLGRLGPAARRQHARDGIHHPPYRFRPPVLPRALRLAPRGGLQLRFIRTQRRVASDPDTGGVCHVRPHAPGAEGPSPPVGSLSLAGDRRLGGRRLQDPFRRIQHVPRQGRRTDPRGDRDRPDGEP